MDNGQCKKSHFQEKVNTHKGLSGESGGQSSQKFGATQRGKFLDALASLDLKL